MKLPPINAHARALFLDPSLGSLPRQKSSSVDVATPQRKLAQSKEKEPVRELSGSGNTCAQVYTYTIECRYLLYAIALLAVSIRIPNTISE